MLFSAFNMFIKKITSLAVTGLPSDQLYFLSLMVTVLPPFEYTGASASESDSLKDGLVP